MKPTACAAFLYAAVLSLPAMGQNQPSQDLQNVDVSQLKKDSSKIQAPPAAAAQDGLDMNQFVGEFAVVSCDTEWKKGDWSLWDYSNSNISQILPIGAGAKDARGRDFIPGAVKIKVERKKDDPDALLVYAADAAGAELSGGRGQPFEAFFMNINRPPVKSGKSAFRDPTMETAPDEDPQIYQEDYHVTKYPNFDLDSTHSSWVTTLKRTASGAALEQRYDNKQGSRSAVTMYIHQTAKDDDSVDNGLELSADGGLTYRARERGENHPDGRDYRDKRVSGVKWDVTQKCVFKRDGSEGSAAR